MKKRNFNVTILDKVLLYPEDIAVLQEYAEVKRYLRNPENEEETVSRIKDADGIILGFTYLSTKALESSKLQYIGIWGTGMRRSLDPEYADSNRITVTTVPHYLYAVNSVAEFVFRQLHRIRLKDCDFKSFYEGKFNRRDISSWTLRGKHIGIIGLGNIGSRVAEIALGYDMYVSAYDPFITNEKKARFVARNVQFNDLDGLLRKSSIVSLHVPVNDNTNRIINQQRLELFLEETGQSPKILINTSSGYVVDNNALLRFLRKKRDFYAIMDIRENEFPVNSSLPLNNLVFTPRCGWITCESLSKKSKITVRNFVKWHKNGSD